MFFVTKIHLALKMNKCHFDKQLLNIFKVSVKFEYCGCWKIAPHDII